MGIIDFFNSFDKGDKYIVTGYKWEFNTYLHRGYDLNKAPKKIIIKRSDYYGVCENYERIKIRFRDIEDLQINKYDFGTYDSDNEDGSNIKEDPLKRKSFKLVLQDTIFEGFVHDGYGVLIYYDDYDSVDNVYNKRGII